MDELKMYQVSTLQALSLGYSRAVITVEELLKHGDIGLGTFEDVHGEMIMVDGHCYQADNNGDVIEANLTTGVPFAAVSYLKGNRSFDIEKINSIDDLKALLTIKIEEDFGLNSVHMLLINGQFRHVSARSEEGRRSQHVPLKEILEGNQKDFFFNDIEGSLICVYYPDYMDGINASGWHLHFISKDRKFGGHVFDIEMNYGHALLDKISGIEIRLPNEPAFDTYALKEASNDDIKKVEQGK
ncbi:MAG: acetolactate decarboxylase [Erysipelotrichaceae bacterium]|nr:acetolactate decarboxylase [Erysipelotrichaceae bacterium]